MKANEVMKTLTILTSVLISLGRSDDASGGHHHHHHHPTPGPVYSYYAPQPTTTTTTTTTTVETTTIPPPPPAPYDAYYDSLYYNQQPSYDSPTYESGGLYYYYYPAASENEIDDTLELTTLIPDEVVETEAPAAEAEPFQFGPLQRLFIILIGLSLAFPSRLSVSVRRRKRDIVDPDLVTIFSDIKDNIVTNISEDYETCIQKFICEATLSEDPLVQSQILKWSQDVGPLLGDLGYHPWQYINLIREGVDSRTCRQQCRILDFFQDFNLNKFLSNNQLQ